MDLTRDGSSSRAVRPVLAKEAWRLKLFCERSSNVKISCDRSARTLQRTSGTLPPDVHAYFFFAARWASAPELASTAARTSCLKATSLIFSPSRKSIARRAFPSRLELKSFFGSLIEAPRAKVSFTTCLYDSPVQTMPSWDQTGVPGDFGFSHFHSSWISGSASWMS